MDFEKLKELLGEDLANQVKAKLGDTPLTVGEGKVPLDRFNEVNTKLKTLEGQVAQMTTLMQTLTAENTALKHTIKTTSVDTKVTDLIKEAGAKDPKVVRVLLEMGEVEDTEEGLAAVKTKLGALKKSAPYLFNGNEVKGNTPDTSNTGTQATVTADDFYKMTYREKVALYNRDKALYDTLSKAVSKV